MRRRIPKNSEGLLRQCELSRSGGLIFHNEQHEKSGCFGDVGACGDDDDVGDGCDDCDDAGETESGVILQRSRPVFLR